MSNLSYYLIIFLLFLLQFIYFPLGISYFEAPKVYAVEFGIFLLLLVQLFRGKLHLPKSKLFLITGGVIIFLSLYHSIFLSQEHTFFGNPFRMQGILLLWFLLLFSYLSSFEPLKKVSPVFIGIVLLSQFILSIWVGNETLERAVGSVGEPNSLAAIMLFVWPFLYFSIQQKKWRIASFFASLIVVSLTLLISGSRSGMVAFFIQLVFFFGVILCQWSLKKVTIACLVLVLISFSLPFVERGIKYENRGEVWQSAITAGLSQPIVGNGFGNAEYAIHNATRKLHNHLQGYYVDSAHNIFLDWWVQGGIIGLSVFLFLVYKTFARFITTKQTRNLLVLLGLLTALCFNPASVILLVGFWWLVGQGIKN